MKHFLNRMNYINLKFNYNHFYALQYLNNITTCISDIYITAHMYMYSLHAVCR